MDQVASEAHRAGQEQTSALLRYWAEQLFAGGRGVEGVYATVRALADGILDTLLITDDPASHHTAWFGPRPGDIAELSTAFSPDTGPLEEAPLADVTVRSALLAGTDVRVLRPGTSGAPAQGIGGLTRHT